MSKLIEPRNQQGAEIPGKECILWSLDHCPAGLAHLDPILILQITDDLLSKIGIAFRATHYVGNQFGGGSPTQQSLDKARQSGLRKSTKINPRINQIFFDRYAMRTRRHDHCDRISFLSGKDGTLQAR